MSQPRPRGKDLRDLIAAIRRSGCEVIHNKRGGHWKVFHDGVFVCTLSSTASNRHADNGMRRDLRRAGIEIP